MDKICLNSFCCWAGVCTSVSGRCASVLNVVLFAGCHKCLGLTWNGVGTMSNHQVCIPPATEFDWRYYFAVIMYNPWPRIGRKLIVHLTLLWLWLSRCVFEWSWNFLNEWNFREVFVLVFECFGKGLIGAHEYPFSWMPTSSTYSHSFCCIRLLGIAWPKWSLDVA